MATFIPPPGATVTYSAQYRRCGKEGCPTCVPGARRHGPYWYAYWREGGRRCSRYLGRERPPQAPTAPTAPTVAPAPALRVRTLGGFTVWRSVEAIGAERWRGRKVAALFKYLLSAPGQRLHREQAVELLWPEAAPEAGFNSLRYTVHELRAILDEPGAVTSHVRNVGRALQLAPGDDAGDDWLDAIAFARQATAALASRDVAACRAALALYDGDYLPDDLYEEWAVARRENLREQYIALLGHLAMLYQGGEAVGAAEECWRRVLALDPCREEAARRFMATLAGDGRRAEALRVYAALVAALKEELDVRPDRETVLLWEGLVAADPIHAPPGNVPAALTPLIGRSCEVADVRAALAETRLLTLTGAGGVGKTCLALEVARALAAEPDAPYPDGVWLVELDAVADGLLVPVAVAAALGVREEVGQLLPDTLCAALRARRLLLALDNCEHLAGACAALAERLLAACAGVRVLATSRQPLGIAGERLRRVPSLALPPAREDLTPAEAEASGAVRLFVARARVAREGFRVTDANAATVAEVCRRLDGIPLALELAAARLGVLSVREVAARLDDRFGLLTGGSKTALPRCQTLRATLDWSYALLNDAEQTLLRRLAVFAGGWTLDAAEAVCPGGDLAPAWVLDGLSSLVDRTLVIVDADEKTRYRLLETVRAYARELLTADDERASMCDRHLTWFLALAERAELELIGARQADWLDLLECEHDNIRAALAWAYDRARIEQGLRLLCALQRFWEVRGYLSEGRRWAKGFLSGAGALPLWGDDSASRTLHVTGGSGSAGDEPDPPSTVPGLPVDRRLRARTLVMGGHFAYQQGDLGPAQASLEEGVALYRALGDQEGIAEALSGLGVVVGDRGELGRAVTLIEEGVALYRALGNEQRLAQALNNLAATVLEHGDHGRTSALYEESLTLYRSVGDRQRVGMVLVNLGLLYTSRGLTAWARARCEEALAIFRDVGNTQGVAYATTLLARIMRDQGQRVHAETLFRQGLALFQELGDKHNIAVCLEGIAEALGERGRLDLAVQLCAAAAALREAIGMPLLPSERADVDRVVAALRAMVRDEEFVATWALGRALTVEQMVRIIGEAPLPL